MILANCTSSELGYTMLSVCLTHVYTVDLETFNSFMLICYCFYWNLVPNLVFIKFFYCV